MNAPAVAGERESLIAFLNHQRQAVRNATYGLTEDQARARSTASALTLGGLIKHLARTEQDWAARVAQGTAERSVESAGSFEEYMESFSLGPEESLTEVLRRYELAANTSDDIVGKCDDLGRRVYLPEAPWYPADCTVRWVVVHLIEETARHAGHADILREALDGALSGPLMAAVEGWPEEGWIKPWRQAH